MEGIRRIKRIRCIRSIEGKLYDRSAIDFNHLLFDRRKIWALLIPLMGEQLLTSLMGMADSLMVTRVGSAAISAVSLTDSINVLMIQIFTALATGGTIICSQYLGHEDLKRANHAAEEVLLSITLISAALGLTCVLFRLPILHLVFGKVERAVMKNAQIYFLVTGISFPFLAIYQACAAFYRAGGNSRFPLTISVIGNVMNIIGNAVYIFAFHWGVFGAALSTLLSRIFIAVVMLYFLHKPRQPIVLKDLLHVRPDLPMIRRILAIGIPSGIENGMFQFGKLAIQSSVSTLGTAAIAAQAMAIILENLNGIAAIGIGIGLMTIVGQTLGAGRTEEAKYYIIKLTFYSFFVMIAGCLLIRALTGPILFLSGMERASSVMVISMMNFITIMKILVWTPAFIPAYGFRAAGDVRFSMIFSTISMWTARVLLVTLLIRVFGFGPIAVWYGQVLDWAVRAAVYTWRYFSGRWLRHKII